MDILRVENIEKNFEKTKVLKDISFTLPQGEALAIIGSSGSGKTTLFNLILCLYLPSSGYIAVDGEKLYCTNIL